MAWVLIGAAIWMAMALVVAVVLGRVSQRADAEELGSTSSWDIGEIDEAVQHDG